MELMINDKTYTFTFGVKFVREIDINMPIKAEGMEFGMGLAARVIPELQGFNINTLSKVLYYANRTESPKLTQNDIDNFIDQHEDIEQLFDEVLTALSESNSGKLALKKFKENLTKQ